MELVKVRTYEEMSKKASDILFDVIKENEKPVIGLATGSTPEGTYMELIKKLNGSDVDQNNITTFNLDEYVGLDKDHEQSYSYYMHENFFNHVLIPKENIHLLNGKDENAEREVEAYEQAIDEEGLDVQLLCVVCNGAIGFNELGTCFDSLTHVVDLAVETVLDISRFVDNFGDVLSKVFSMGLSSIMKAKIIVMLFYGENKNEALNALLSGD